MDLSGGGVNPGIPGAKRRVGWSSLLVETSITREFTTKHETREEITKSMEKILRSFIRAQLFYNSLLWITRFVSHHGGTVLYPVL